MTNPAFYALLVGINRYASPTVPDLGGSVNDVVALAELLRTRFAVPPAQIHTLTDEQATLAAVRAAFQTYLIAPARTWAAAGAVGEPPALLFHFSGHGSQAPDPTQTEPDGLDETLVCHDSRLPDHYDLKDWELGLLLDEAAQYTHNITVILDCCHSGGGTRAGETTKPIADTRGCAIDRRPQPVGRPPALQVSAATRSGRAPVANAWVRGSARHVLLAACRDQEKAHEHAFALEQGSVRHGVLTQTLIQLLRMMPAEHPITYHELHEQLVIEIRQLYRAQHPQCEGDWGRLIFGGVGPARDLWWRVVAVEGSEIWVEGGAAHQLAKGDRLAIYPPTARTAAGVDAPVGTLEILRTEATRSLCRLVEAGVVIPLNARVVRISAATSERRALALVMDSGMTADAIRTRLAQADLAGLIELRPATATADLRLLLTPDALELQDGAGQRLFRRYPLRDLNRARRPLRADDLNPVAAELAQIVQAQLLALLQNPHSTLAGVVVLGIKRLVQRGAAVDVSALPTAVDGVCELPSGEPFVVEITNSGNQPLYLGLLACWPNGTVRQLYPQVGGAQEALAAQQPLKVGLRHEPAWQLRLDLPAGLDTEMVTLKLIASHQPTTFDALLQVVDDLPAPDQPSTYIDPAKRTRHFQLRPKATVGSDWTTATLTVRLVRKPPSDQAPG